MMKMIHRRSLLRDAGLLGASLPFFGPIKALAASAEDPILSHVHPELRLLAAQIISGMAKMKPLSPETLPQNRALTKAMAKPRLSDIPVERRAIPGKAGSPEIVVYLINGEAGKRRAGILHTHGGGFVSGSAEAAIRDMQDLCKALDCTAVSVEYRLAPETTWQGSTEDNYAALKWLHVHADELGVDPARIAVYGESAGGGHAALLAIMARDRGEVPVAFQCLVYPMLDDRTGSTTPVPPHVGSIIWTPADNRFGWESFLGRKPGGKSVPAAAVPARTVNLAGLPPAFIGVGSIDLFHDEDVQYARRLNDAGVPSELIVIPGAFHGFDILPPPTRVATWFNAAKVEALRRGLGISLHG